MKAATAGHLDRLTASRLDGVHQCLTVIALVGDDHLEGHFLQERLGLGDVRRLTGRQHELDLPRPHP
jgi:hypothetical protein